MPELAPDQQVSIVWESYNAGGVTAGNEAVEKLETRFEELNPNIDVTVKPPSGGVAEIAQSVQRQVVAGDPPDVAQRPGPRRRADAVMTELTATRAPGRFVELAAPTPRATGVPPSPRRGLLRRAAAAAPPYLYVLPALTGLVVWIYLPLAQTFQLPFTLLLPLVRGPTPLSPATPTTTGAASSTAASTSGSVPPGASGWSTRRRATSTTSPG